MFGKSSATWLSMVSFGFLELPGAAWAAWGFRRPRIFPGLFFFSKFVWPAFGQYLFSLVSVGLFELPGAAWAASGFRRPKMVPGRRVRYVCWQIVCNVAFIGCLGFL